MVIKIYIIKYKFKLLDALGEVSPWKKAFFGDLRKQNEAWRCFGGITRQANLAVNRPKVLGPL